MLNFSTVFGHLTFDRFKIFCFCFELQHKSKYLSGISINEENFDLKNCSISIKNSRKDESTFLPNYNINSHRSVEKYEKQHCASWMRILCHLAGVVVDSILREGRGVNRAPIKYHCTALLYIILFLFCV